MADGTLRLPVIAAASVPTPPSGKVFLFIDSADKHVKSKDDADVISDLTIGNPDFDSITDPVVDAAVTQAIIDASTGTVITTTAAANSQTLASPTDTTAGKLFTVINDDASTDIIAVNGVGLTPGNLSEFYWDGTAWTQAAALALPGGADTQIQYNKAGVLEGDPNHTWDDASKREKVLGDIEQVGGEAGNLYTPTIVSTTATGSNPRRSEVLGNYLYVVDDASDDLRIFDVTDPAVPAQVGSLGGLGNCRGVDVAGDLVFVSSDNGAGFMHIVNVADKANLVLVSTTTVGGVPRGVRVVGATAFVSGQTASQGLTAIDITDPVNPVVLDTLVTASSSIRTEFDVAGGIAYLVSSSGTNSFFIVDVSDPSNLVTLAVLNLDTDNWAVRTVGRYAYMVSQGSADLAVFDVSDPANTSVTPVGSVSLGVGASPRALDVRGNFAYVVDAALDRLLVVDVSDPTAPVIISDPLAVGAQSVSISTVGRFAYITDVEDNNFRVVDLTGLDAQNLNVGNIDAGDVNVRRDVKAAGSLNANAAVLGAGGLFSDGPAVAAGHRLAGIPINTIEVYEAADLPTTLLANTRYLIKAPITITAGNEITIPDAGNVVIESVDRLLSDITYTGTTGTLFTAAALTGSVHFRNVNITGGLVASRLFNITGSGFPSFSILSGQYNNWGDLGTFSGIGGGVDVGEFGASGNLDGFKIVNSSFFGMNNSFIQNFSDTLTNFIDIASDVSRVAITLTGFAAQPNERLLNINSGFTGEAILNTVFAVPTGQVFNSSGLDETSIYVTAANVSNNAPSRTIGSFFVNDNAAVTVVAAQDTFIDLNLGASATEASNIERWSLTNTTTGEVTYDGVQPFKGTVFAHLSILAASGSPHYAFRAVKNGAVMVDAIEMSVETPDALTVVTVGFLVPVSVVKDDTVRLQVENRDGTDNITIVDLSMAIQ